MKKWFSSQISTALLLLLMPYLAVILINGADMALTVKKPSPENFLPIILSLQISDNYEKETLKAQAVIARSNLYRQLSEGTGFFHILTETGEKLKNAGFFETFLSLFSDGQQYQEAVSETENQILTYDGNLKLVPWHEISGGSTRDGTETLRDEEFSYLKSVDSSADKTSPDYLTGVYVSASRMPETLEIQSRDSAGYVTSLLADGRTLEGEAFRQGMGLPSANFTIQKIGSQYRFLCKGKGHGLGFSQYGGNDMAKNGSSWEEILEKYFPEMEISDVYSLVILDTM